MTYTKCVDAFNATCTIGTKKAMEYNLSEVTRYAVECANCDTSTGNHSKKETAQKSAEQKGFIVIATAADGAINLCPACIPADVAKFFVTAHDLGLKDPGPIDDAKASDEPGLPLEGEKE